MKSAQCSSLFRALYLGLLQFISRLTEFGVEAVLSCSKTKFKGFLKKKKKERERELVGRKGQGSITTLAHRSSVKLKLR
jgi:hypothetical protein